MNAPTQGRLFLHVGLHKTGTTYLQNLLRANRQQLRRHGIGLPSGRQSRLILAALDLTGRDVRGTPDAGIAGSWHRLAAEVTRSEAPTVVVSEERLSLATARQARRAVESFADLDVHVVVTVRDLARVLVSQWQEEIRNGNTWTLDEYVAAVRDPLAAATNPARGFWRRQDVGAVVTAWSTAVPADRVHLVTVPPPGAPADGLALRFGHVVGFGADAVPAEPPWRNENTGTIGTELLRRLNERLRANPAGGLDSHAYNHGVKGPLVPLLAQLPDKGSTDLSADDTTWARARATEMARELEDLGLHVVGTPTDLVPGGKPEQSPQQPAPTDSRLLDAALDALAVLSTRQGQAQSHDREAPPAGGSRTARAGSIARSMRFRALRGSANLAGRTAVGRRAAAAYLRRRSGH